MITSFRDISAGFGTTAESRLFAGICAVLTVFFVGFFTAGLFLGHRQLDSKLLVATGALPVEVSSIAPVGRELPVDRRLIPAPASVLPEAAESAKPASAIAPLSAAVLAGKEAAVSTRPAALSTPGASSIPRGAIVVQVAALLSHARAQELVQSLQQKNFSAFELSSGAGADRFNRVQIGPFSDVAAAKIVRDLLQSQGYQPIISRR